MDNFIIEKIKDHLLSTYKTYALLFHGSRVRGDQVNTSDFDLIVVTDNPELVKPHAYNEWMLDVSGMLPETQLLKSANKIIWPIHILYDDKNGWGNKIFLKTQKTFNKGPESISTQEWCDRKHYVKRLINRLNGRGYDRMVRFCYLSDLYERMIRYWFEKKSIMDSVCSSSCPHHSDSRFCIL